MAATIESEIKLRFESAAAAREAVLAIGGTPLHARRLQEDCLFDTSDELVRRRRSVLRVRSESGQTLLTFKGPVQSSRVKMREEIETIVANGPVLVRMLEELGFRVWFRYQKYREEFALNEVVLAIDETPIGTFVEIEGGEGRIADTALALGRGPGDYVLDSYRGLFEQYCRERRRPVGDMIFETD
jgi:adenylate cyclase, class 2